MTTDNPPDVGFTVDELLQVLRTLGCVVPEFPPPATAGDVDRAYRNGETRDVLLLLLAEELCSVPLSAEEVLHRIDVLVADLEVVRDVVAKRLAVRSRMD